MEKIINMWKMCAVSQIIGWMFLTIADFFQENYSKELFGLVFWGTIVIYTFLYIRFRTELYGTGRPKFKDIWGFVWRWIVIAVLLGFLIYMMTCEWNIWFVEQELGGWEHFLNGIEYILFAMWIGAVPVLEVFLFETVYYFVSRKRN